MGKTNLLDAIHYLSLGKSYFNPVDSQNISYDEDYFNVKGKILLEGEEHTIFCAFQKGRKKKIRVDGIEFKKLADHVGKFPVVMITPYDIDLILEGSEKRRKFLDNLLSHISRQYLDDLSKYTQTLFQRNARLKKMAEQGSHDKKLIEVYDEQLAKLGHSIFEQRKAFMAELSNIFQECYQVISGRNETVMINYQSDLFNKNMKLLLDESYKRDCLFQRTTRGIHKDDLEFFIEGHPIKKFGSQGQQKSFVIALKLAQAKILEQHKSFPPLLLLDDIHDRLDEKRVGQLLEIVTKDNYEQVFITDISAGRIKEALKPFTKDYSMYEIEKGKIINDHS